MERPLGVRKGKWSKEEDDLLRACIQRHGEGKWHLVPQRAGLNRCRKSCRLRWMNYLKPDIKRGNFTEDEVDMIMRFHRLLGNRWSLIAARFPGRTSNDVKNFYNSYLRKKLPYSSQNNNKEEKHEETTKTHQVIKPRPLTFSRNSSWLRGKPIVAINNNNNNTDDDSGNNTECDHQRIENKDNSEKLPCPASPEDQSEKQREWWESLLDDIKGGDERGSLWCLGGDFWDDDFSFWNDPQI